MGERLFRFLFKYPRLVFEQGDFTWAISRPLLVVIVLAAAGVVVAALLTYRRVGTLTRTRDRAVLIGLRLAVLVLLLFCLLRPTLILKAAVPQQNFLGVLLDDSRSMAIADRGSETRAAFVQQQFGGKDGALLRGAESELKGLKADEALLPGQRALNLLQDAEQEYETQVAMQPGGGGGGGGGQSAMAEDLANLFDLELDKLANQYEMQQRAEQQSNDRQVDALVEKLKELARRQQQEAQRQRRMAAAGQQAAGGGSSAAQRALADEMQEAARRLQQLTRDQPRQDLRDAAQRMQEAADAMRQAAANGSKDGGAQANAALDRLREAQQKLEGNQGVRTERDVQQAQHQAQELANEQKEVASQVQALAQAGAARQARAQALGQRKDAMDAKLGDLQQQLETLGNDTRRDDRDASRKLDEAAGSIRDRKIREKIRYSKGTLNGQPSEDAKAMEDDIGANLEALQKKIGDASGAMDQAKKQDAMARAAEKARDLVKGLESLNERTREGMQEGKGQEGSQGSQGSRGQNAQGQGGGQPNGGANAGALRFGAGAGRAQPGMSAEGQRQFRREQREWQGDAQALRQQLQAAGVNPRDLDQVMRDLQALDSDRAVSDLKGLQQLQAAAIDHLKKFEFSLHKRAEPAHDSLSLSGSDEVPAGFRQSIEEYYRALAKKPGGQIK